MNAFCIFGDYVYLEPMGRIYTFKPQEVKQCLESLNKECGNGFFVGYVSYEMGSQASSNTIPLLDFILFKKRKKLHKYLFPQPTLFYPQILKPLDWKQYNKDFNAIKKQLKKGNTYQVNYTQEIHLTTQCLGIEIFNSLFKIQNTRYKAYLKNEYLEIVSFSPELFFALSKNTITLQPMKGTIPRGMSKREDKSNKKFLQQDSKSRSENIMIVDLLRNDISQIAKPNTLKIKDLLAIHTYPSVHQMVSTLKAKLPKETSLYDIFSALFPCGSITGAPKKSTMQIIQTLENRNRGVYCGSIGVVSKKEAIFSVPIRTLVRYRDEAFYRYGVGSGVVWESESKEEFRELELKSQFLFRANENFCLLETMLYRDGEVFLGREHLLRMLSSATQLGFITTKLEKLYQQISDSKRDSIVSFFSFIPHSFETGWDRFPRDTKGWAILRLLLAKNGQVELNMLPLKTLKSKQVYLSSQPVHSRNDLLYHKTTLREWYKEAQKKWGEFFDVLYVNEKGEICEGGRSNIVILKNNELLTPSAKSGLLRGVLRELLLQNNLIKECILYEEDLKEANEIFCINSVRGIVKVDYEALNCR